MITTIHKHQLKAQLVRIDMQHGAKILCAQLQNGIPCLWYEVNPNQRLETRTFEIFGTGWSLDEAPRKYISTIQDESLVWHVYERL